MARGKTGPPRRRVTRDEIRKDVLVFSEGKLTETDYILHWYRKHRTKVNVAIDDSHGVPRTLIDSAVDAKLKSEREEKRGRGRAYDEVWLVHDVDQHPALDEVRQKAHANAIGLAISNPCIELWFILHFEQQTAYIGKKAAQDRSGDLIRCGKALSKEALARLEENYEDARDRALRLDVKHEGDGNPEGSNPSSSLWRLIDSIRDG